MAIEIVTVSSRGQLVIPERLRKKKKIKEGSRLVLIEREDGILMRKEEAVTKTLEEEQKEEAGWLALAEQAFKELWDNEKDDEVWVKYLA